MAGDLEGGSSANYVSYSDKDLGSGYGAGVFGRCPNFKELAVSVTKFQMIFFVLCLILMVLGIISFFDGIAGMVLGALTILLAIFGLVGGFLAHQYLLIAYLIGLAILFVLTVIGMVFDFITISYINMIINVVLAIFYAASGAMGLFILFSARK